MTDVPEVRREAAWGLNFLSDPRSLGPLCGALFLPDVESPIRDFCMKPEKAQQAVAGALAGLEDERAADDFVRLLDNPESSGMPEAVIGLVRLRDHRVLHYLDRFAKTEWTFPWACTIAGTTYQPETLRRELLAALAEMGAERQWMS